MNEIIIALIMIRFNIQNKFSEEVNIKEGSCHGGGGGGGRTRSEFLCERSTGGKTRRRTPNHQPTKTLSRSPKTHTAETH